MLSTFAISYPLLTGDMVKQGHSDYCAAHGHASWVEDNVDKGVCPRCGTVTRPFYVDAPTPAPTPAQLTDAVIAADAERMDARAALRAAEHAAFGTYMGSGDWRSVDVADARVAASERAYLSACHAVNQALRQGI